MTCSCFISRLFSAQLLPLLLLAQPALAATPDVPATHETPAVPAANMLAEAAKLPAAIELSDLERIEDITRFCISEKLDGQRGRWDGKRLISRSGSLIFAPRDFLAKLPSTPLDGELYCDEGFEASISSIRTDFACVRLHVFDAPSAPGGLLERLKTVLPNEKVKIIPQTRLRSAAHARQIFERLTARGAEGVVLHDCDLPYQASYARGNFYKLKRYFTGVCTIVAAHESAAAPGELGSYSCGWDGGEYGGVRAPAQVIKIGSGFDAAHRAEPLAIGTRVQFKFYRFTKAQKPRHAVFLRVDSE